MCKGNRSQIIDNEPECRVLCQFLSLGSRTNFLFSNGFVEVLFIVPGPGVNIERVKSLFLYSLGNTSRKGQLTSQFRIKIVWEVLNSTGVFHPCHSWNSYAMLSLDIPMFH